MARRGRTIDFKQWTGLPGVTDDSSMIGNKGGGNLPFTISSTILRVRGGFWAGLDATAVNGDLVTLTVALGIVSSDAATAGAASLPDPGVEFGYPWLYWKEIRLASFSSIPVTGWGPSHQYYEIDSKAMRRVHQGQSLVSIIDVTSNTGAVGLHVEISQSRVLVGT